jgi:lipopolysaccharide cholinephosphotransferase
MKKISYTEATLVGSYHTWSFNKEALPKDFYGEGEKVKFEDVEAIVPSNYDAYLTAKYGNYLELPPENKREGHHKNYGFSLTVGYKDYIFKDKR